MKICRFLLASAISIPSLFTVASATPIAYASNEGSGTVSVVDTASDKVTATFTTGGKPRGIAASLDGKRLFVSEQESNSVLIIDTETGATIGKTPVGNSPEGITYRTTESGSRSQ